jgi:hypothetical protein
VERSLYFAVVVVVAFAVVVAAAVAVVVAAAVVVAVVVALACHSERSEEPPHFALVFASRERGFSPRLKTAAKRSPLCRSD